MYSSGPLTEKEERQVQDGVGKQHATIIFEALSIAGPVLSETGLPWPRLS